MDQQSESLSAVIGQRLERVEASLKVTGRARYAAENATGKLVRDLPITPGKLL